MLYCKLPLITYNFVRGLRRAYDWNRKSSSKQVTTVVLIKIRFTFTNQISGLSLRGGGRGFPPATMYVFPGYFQRKMKEK